MHRQFMHLSFTEHELSGTLGGLGWAEARAAGALASSAACAARPLHRCFVGARCASMCLHGGIEGGGVAASQHGTMPVALLACVPKQAPLAWDKCESWPDRVSMDE